MKDQWQRIVDYLTDRSSFTQFKGRLQAAILISEMNGDPEYWIWNQSI